MVSSYLRFSPFCQNLLKATPAFQSLNQDQLNILLEKIETIEYKDNETIIEMGDDGEYSSDAGAM